MILTLHIGVSYRCNMRCEHCFVHKNSDRLDTDTILRTIRQLSEKGLFVVYYTFGEPTLSPLWLPIVRQVHQLGLVQVLMSNGYMIDDAMAQAIKDAGVSRVMISIDHILPEEHDKNRGIAGAHRKALSAIENLQRYGVPVGIATTITPGNADVIRQIYGLAESCGVSSVSFLRERKQGVLEENGFEPYYDFFDSYIRQKKPSVSVQFHDPMLLSRVETAFHAGCFDRSLYEKWTEMNQCHCQSTLAIAPNGDVMRCNLSQSVIGNICEADIDVHILEEGDKHERFICRTVVSGQSF